MQEEIQANVQQELGWCSVDDPGGDGSCEDTLSWTDDFVLLNPEEFLHEDEQIDCDDSICTICRRELAGWVLVKERCKACGRPVCETCSPHFVSMPHLDTETLSRACTRCYEMIEGANVLDTDFDDRPDACAHPISSGPSPSSESIEPPDPEPEPSHPETSAEILAELSAPAGPEDDIPSELRQSVPRSRVINAPNKQPHKQRRIYREVRGRRPAAPLRGVWVSGRKKPGQPSIWSRIATEIQGLLD